LRVPTPEQPAGELGAAEQRPALMREQTLADLYAARETSGHPESVHREGRRLYWDEAEAMAWAQERNRRRRPRSPRSLTPVDRSGRSQRRAGRVGRRRGSRPDPGLRQPADDQQLSRPQRGYFPDPDDIEGRHWHRRTLWAFADRRSRPGRAGHAKTRSDQR
jgi:hypothetical protein